MEDRVAALEAWRKTVEPDIELLLALSIPTRLLKLEAGLAAVEEAVAKALNEWARAGKDIREAAQIMVGNTTSVKQGFMAMNDKLDRFLEDKL